MATAQETYKDYLKLAIEHPEMADGDPPPKAAKSYGWFMSNLQASIWSSRIQCDSPVIVSKRSLLAFQLPIHRCYSKLNHGLECFYGEAHMWDTPLPRCQPRL